MNGKRLALLGILPFLTACYGTYHTATPIPKGNFELVAAPGVLMGFSSDRLNPVPNLELGVRYGVNDHLDIGALSTIFGGALDLNVAIINEESFAFSINPAFAVIRIPAIFNSDPTFASLGSIGLLADVLKSESVIVTLGVKPGFVTPVDEPDLTFTVSAVALAKFRIAKRFAIAPALEVMTPAEALMEGVILRANLALLF